VRLTLNSVIEQRDTRGFVLAPDNPMDRGDRINQIKRTGGVYIWISAIRQAENSFSIRISPD